MPLFEAWQALSANANETIHSFSKQLFASFQQAVCDMISADVVLFSRLSDNDERLFEQAVRLMGTYREASRIIETAKAPHPAVKELLAGIGDVLTSRLKEYEDNLVTEDTPNPVADEKSNIIASAKSFTAKKIEDMANSFPENNATTFRGVFLLEEGDKWRADILSVVNSEAVQQEIYAHYQEGLRFCLLGLDDLHGRKAARFYTELIESEGEMLEAMIRVQVQAFEMALEAHPCEAAVQVLDMLREAYQQTRPLVEMLQGLPKGDRKSVV